MAKTKWKVLINDTKKLDGKLFKVETYASHYLGFNKYSKIRTYKNKWIALLFMKGRAILLDLFVENEYSIRYSIKAI